MSKATEAHSDKLGKDKAMEQSELGDHGPIEKVTENDFAKTAELAAFMNNVLTILIHPSSEEGALDVVTPQVNGLNQPVIRGVESKIKRKYVEALARTRGTKYVQRIVDSNRPENIQLVSQTTLSYPFAVLYDPSPNGRQWLDGILSQT